MIRIYFILGKDYNGERPAPPGSFIPRKDRYGVPIAEPQVGLQGYFSLSVVYWQRRPVLLDL